MKVLLQVNSLCPNFGFKKSTQFFLGEPLPIRKFPLRAEAFIFDSQSSGKNNSLFAGTTIKQALTEDDEKPIALVLKTRTNTDKGQLVQRILFPQPVSFIFNEQLKLVFCLLLLWALILLGFGAWWLGGSGMTAWFYGTVCAAQVMNPLLPGKIYSQLYISTENLQLFSYFGCWTIHCCRKTKKERCFLCRLTSYFNGRKSSSVLF